MAAHQQWGLSQVSTLREVWCFDVGTAITRVSIGTQQFQHSSQCLYSRSQKEVVALGNKLAATATATAQVSDAVIVEPLSKARFTDLDQAVSYLRTIRQQLKPQDWWREWLPTSQVARVAVPSQAFPSDRQVLERIFRLAGWSDVTLLSKSHAYWQHLRTQLSEGSIGGVVDIGADMTELVIFDQHHVLGASTWYQGSNDLTRLIQKEAQRRLSAQLTWAQADQVKKHLVGIWSAALAGKLQMKHFAVRGREVHTGSSTNVSFPAAILHEIYAEWYQELLSKIQSVLLLPSVNRSVKLNELRFWLGGGGGQLPGLEEVLGVDLSVSMNLIANPDQAVLKGLVVS